MRKALDASQCVGIAKLFVKDDFALDWHSSALARYAEFFLEGRFDVRYRFDFHILLLKK